MDKHIASSELDIVDLGAASVETKGAPGAPQEPTGQAFPSGISHD